MAEQLYEVAAEFAQLRGHERVFDLYCGIGTIGLTLAARAREVVGVEIVEPAVADAIENARLNDVLNARFYAGDIRLAMRDLVEQAGRPDVAVVDPPRAGLSQKVVRRIIEAQPSRDRLRLVQPDHAGAERRADGRGRLPARARPSRGHVPADAAHRVRGAARARLASGGARGERRLVERGQRAGDLLVGAATLTAMPQCEARISTSSSAAPSRQARQSTMPSERE